MTRSISLPHGQIALVDDADYERINAHRWHVASGYARRKLTPTSTPIKMHHEVLRPPAGFETDHINGNKLDNRLCNLRIATRDQNMYNKRAYKNNTSGYKGVCWKKENERWVAQINIGRKRVCLGYFDDAIAAAQAYDAAASEHYGEFARLNFE